MEVNIFNETFFGSDSRILLVIAHPDDESMFFSPFLLSCAKNGCQVSILCLSEGDFDGLGSIRKLEILASADQFLISSQRVVVVNDPLLLDGPLNHWSPERIAWHIHDAVKQFSVNKIVTFDDNGVSGIIIR